MVSAMRNNRLLTLIFIVMIVGLTIGSFVYINNLARQTVMDSVHSDIENTAGVIASQINGDTFAAIRPGDESTPAFIALRNSLHRIKEANPTFRYIYTMRQDGSTVEFVVDGDYGFVPDAAKIGAPYMNYTPAMLSGFIEPAADSQFTTDQWGETISGYAPIRTSSGRSVGLVGVDEDRQTVAQDMTRLRTVNYELLIILVILFAIGAIIFDIRRTRVEALTELAIRKLNQLNSIIRHDIFNTLTGLIGYVEMARVSETLHEVKEKLTTISSLTDKILHQVAFTRDYQDLGINMPRWQNVQEIAKKAASQLKLPEGTIELDFAGLEIYADPLLDRVFFHIFENSTSTGQGVTRIHGYYQQVDSGVVIIIEDNGIGIPADQKEAIFNRTANRDTGLGLFLVREIFNLTGITVTETGVPGTGSRFEVQVPKNAARVTAT